MYNININNSPFEKKFKRDIKKLRTSNPTEQDKHLFLDLVNTYMLTSNHFNLFEKIISYRFDEITAMLPITTRKGNLYTTFTCIAAQSINGVTPLPTLPSLFFLIEKTAILFFDDILSCWAEFRVYQLTEKAERDFLAHDTGHSYTYEYSEESDGYGYEVVDNIKDDHRLFSTCYSNIPMRLSLANVLINLETFVKQQHWYEMLYYLDVSANGEHFIMYQKQQGGYSPLLLSSALIQRWGQHNNWLTFEHFFQTENWTLTLSNEKIQTLEKSGVFSNALISKINTTSIERFDYSLLKTIKQKNAVCEIIRMAISGPRIKLNYILYLTLKYLTVKLADIGLEVAYTIVEQPSILNFYCSVNDDSKKTLPYVSLCEQKVEGTDLTTYQGLVFTGPMSQTFKLCSFRDYNKRIIRMRKQKKTSTRA